MSESDPNLLASDLDDILSHTQGIWGDLDGAQFFITGGTGFIGTWMLESLFWARRKTGARIGVTVLARDPGAFFRKAPHLKEERDFDFVVGDIRDFEFPLRKYSHIIHAATAASAQMNLENPFEMIDTIVGGARRVFDFAGQCGATKLLHTSSGGIYGRQPDDMATIGEDFLGAPDPMDPHAAYSESKRLAEMMGCIASRKHGFDHKVARITALVGPHLPLDIHYAIGNFIRDAMAGQPIRILGDGTPVRSYMYIADLVAWLWVILARGANNRPYNAGSDKGISMIETARLVGKVHGGGSEVTIANRSMNDGRPNRYVPSIDRAKTELALAQWIDLESAIGKTLDWHRARATGRDEKSN